MHHNRLVAALVVLILDALWVYFVMTPRYKAMIKEIQRGTPLRLRAPAAVLAYGFMIIGLLVFCVRDEDAPVKAAMRGALFGFVLYGLYDSTNAAVFDRFDISLAVLDVVWGAFVYGLATGIAASLK